MLFLVFLLREHMRAKIEPATDHNSTIAKVVMGDNSSDIVFHLSPFHSRLLNTSQLIQDCQRKIFEIISHIEEKQCQQSDNKEVYADGNMMSARQTTGLFSNCSLTKQVVYLLKSMQSHLVILLQQQSVQRDFRVQQKPSNSLLMNFEFEYRGLLLRLSFLLSCAWTLLMDDCRMITTKAMPIIQKKQNKFTDYVQQFEVINYILSCACELKERQLRDLLEEVTTVNSRWLYYSGPLDKHDLNGLFQIESTAFFNSIDDIPYSSKSLSNTLKSMISLYAAYATVMENDCKQQLSDKYSNRQSSTMQSKGIEKSRITTFHQRMKILALYVYYQYIDKRTAAVKAETFFKNTKINYLKEAQDKGMPNFLLFSNKKNRLSNTLKILSTEIIKDKNNIESCNYCNQQSGNVQNNNEAMTNCTERLCIDTASRNNYQEGNAEVISLIDSNPLQDLHELLTPEGNSTMNHCKYLHHKYFHISYSDESEVIRDSTKIKVICRNKMHTRIYSLWGSLNTKFFGSKTKSYSGDIMFHLGGGYGIIASAEDSYLERWSLAGNLPIFSVEIDSISGMRPFTKQIEECYTIYRWLIQNSHKITDAPLNRVIVAAESSAAAILMAVIMRCIIEKVKVPDLCILSYPWLYMPMEISSSRLCSLMTPFVNLHYLHLIGKEYQGSNNAEHAEADPWLSPIIMPDELVKNFPPTYASVGGLDPLLDDSIYLGRRLRQNDVPVKIEVYDGLDHGFLHASHSIETVGEAIDNIGKMILSFR